MINNSGDHLLGLINDVLDISKIDAGKLNINQQDFDLDEVIDKIRMMFFEMGDQKQIDVLLLTPPPQ